MKQYRLIDNVLGWVAFFIAAFVYCSTIEPTASFWDCPEFTTTGYKLEVGHPPGAPFFMLTANLFSQFASDPSDVARMVNTMSALLSATCILFLFWTITHLVRRLLINSWEELTPAKTVAIEASGLVGALIYTFSDTFWFSAVEGEVYAYSSAFTAVVFWLILKWEDHADEPHSDRWLVLIAYMTGLSIGVHLLNLLCIPAIVLVFYYKKYPNADLKGSLIALLMSDIIVAAVLYGVVPGIITVGGWFEWFFVNDLGMPFNTGEIIYIFLLIATVVWAIYESYVDKNNMRINVSFLLSIAMLGIPFYGFGWSAFFIGIVVLAALYFLLQLKDKKTKAYYITSRIKNTILTCMLMLMIGYSTYAITVVRSSANPPMDQNSPEDIFTLGNYLSRDQYGDRPLLYGQAYSSQVKLIPEGDYCRPVQKKGAPIIQRVEKKSPDEKDRYFVVRTKDSYVYAQNMLFPRMHSSEENHQKAYNDWMGGIDTYPVEYDRCGQAMTIEMPTQWENLRFFLSYQCNFMYWRYFMWNFAGRQNDIQGHGELEKGNWITGIPFIDNAMLGDQSKLPDDLKNNKGHNVFYCLPLLLGLIGLFWQAYSDNINRKKGSKTEVGKKGIQQFWVVFFLFFMTGLAIVIYLNQTPLQPRERDYAYAGSFYAFSIWCGMGVAAIINMVFRYLTKKENLAVAAAIGIASLLVPIQMASQTWDDHDRSGRYTCRDFGQNYLNSMQKGTNPIIFTNGDNDTFPLWYNQDVEGVGTDARVCNLSYLQTDWYIDQMVRPAYDSPALPITWKRIDYCSGTNEYITVEPELKQQLLRYYAENPEEAALQYGKDPFDLTNIMKYWVRGGEGEMHCIPTDTVYVTIDRNAILKSGMKIPAGMEIPEKMAVSLTGKSALYKNDLMMLEMINNANWTRPLYVAATVGAENFMNLGENFIQEGLVNRITPFATNDSTNFDADRSYDVVMNRFKFGGLDKPGLYIDETVMRMCHTHRRLFGRLIMKLIQEGKKDKAAKCLAYVEKQMPTYNVPLVYLAGGPEYMEAYFLLGQKTKAKEAFETMWNNSLQYIKWYMSLNQNRFFQSQRECMYHFYVMQNLLAITYKYDEAMATKLYPSFQQMVDAYRGRGGRLAGDE